MKRKTEFEQGDVEADDGQSGHDESSPAAAFVILERLKERDFGNETERAAKKMTLFTFRLLEENINPGGNPIKKFILEKDKFRLNSIPIVTIG